MTHCPRCGRRLDYDPRDGSLSCFYHSEQQPPAIEPPIEEQEASRKWTPVEEAFLLARTNVTQSNTTTAKQMTQHFREVFGDRELSDEELTAVVFGTDDTGITGYKRTLKSVKHYLARMGVSKPRVKGVARGPRPTGWWSTKRSKVRWTEEELAALEDGEIKMLSRSRSAAAIAFKAWQIGQPVRSGDGALSLRQVSQQFAVRPDTVSSWLERGLLPATRSGRMWRIDPGDAEREVPRLKRIARANHGKKGWWKR